METTTHRVMKVLERHSRMLDAGELCIKTRRSPARVKGALWQLHRKRAVMMKIIDGERYFRATPARDERERVIIWRKEETRPRARRSGRGNTAR